MYIYVHVNIRHRCTYLLGHSVIRPRPDRRMQFRFDNAYGYKGSSLKQDACVVHIAAISKVFRSVNHKCVFEKHSSCRF